jgi:hypothetical protein
VPYCMAMLGHADPKVTLGIYARVLRRERDAEERLDALVGASEWAEAGRSAPVAVSASTPVDD